MSHLATLLPATAGLPDVAAPRTAFLARARPVALRIARTWWDVEVRGSTHVPAVGPVVLAANHVGWLDGPLLVSCAPRPVHALTKVEMFRGPVGALLSVAGQVPLDRFTLDTRALRVARRALEQDLVVGVFPEGVRGAGDMLTSRSGAAYLAMVSGAPVVPVAFLGTRERGGDADSVPARGTRVALSFGEPLDLGRHDWPRTHVDVARAGARVSEAIIQTIREAEQATGMTLPGPLGTRTARRSEKRS